MRKSLSVPLCLFVADSFFSTSDVLDGWGKGIRNVKNRTRFRNMNHLKFFMCFVSLLSLVGAQLVSREPVDQALRLSSDSTTQCAAFHSLRVFPIRASVRMPAAGTWCTGSE